MTRGVAGKRSIQHSSAQECSRFQLKGNRYFEWIKGQYVVKSQFAATRHSGTDRDLGQCDRGIGPLCVIGRVAVFGYDVFGIGRVVTVGHEPVKMR